MSTESSSADALQAQLVQAVDTFSIKFYNEVAKEKSAQSLVMSPFLVQQALAILALGTEGDSHQELLQALQLPSADFIRSAYPTVNKNLKALKGVTLDLANKLYVMEGNYELHPEFHKETKECFDADVETINFSESKNAADTINQWVETKTNNRIKKLVSEDTMTSDTRLVLVNAIYFKGFWKHKFNPKSTKPAPFHVSACQTIEVPMMFLGQKKFKHGYSEKLNCQMIELPYEGDEVSMVIFLPHEVEGLQQLRDKLGEGSDLTPLLADLHLREIYVSLPKFKIETEIKMNDVLKKLGIEKIFDAKSSGLSRLLKGQEGLFLSDAIHKAFIEVNEEGCEAAAATAMGVRKKRAVEQFMANHPFLVGIVAGEQLLFVSSYLGIPASTTQTSEDDQSCPRVN